MRPARDLLIAVALLAVIGLGVWAFVHRQRLAYQLAAYRIGTAETSEEARAEIRRLEQGPNPELRLDELVGKWGTGNPRFDFYLARYVGDGRCSEALRRRFSLEFAWRREVLPRWAHYWSWRAGGEPDQVREPDQVIDSIVRDLDMKASAEPGHTLTWREVLDLQAIFVLTGEPELAVRLKPDDWLDRFRPWHHRHRGRMPHVERPKEPLPDWEGPLPR
jgi:hypothetical protein